MKRRTFLKTAGGVSVPMMLGGLSLRTISASPLFDFINGDNDRILVLVQLNGGNDGLNTIIPLDQYDKLANARPNILLPQSSLIGIDGDNALHPNMTGFKELYDLGKVNIVQSVGYPDQNRSHFRSTDIWMTASDSDEYLSSGWVGRHLQDQFPTFPEGYPNADCPDPIAITVGPLVSETCQGLVTNFSMAVPDLDSVSTVIDVGGDDVPPGCYGEELVFLRQSIAQTNAYAETITNAADQGNSMSTKYPSGSRLAQQLKTVATLISGGLQTKIYVVSIGGFDTHANQVEDGDPLTGIHAELLQQLSDSLCAFHDDLSLMGLGERVLSMTFSEFGRRIKSNNSLGTDHGTAAPMFLFGDCINPAIVGDNPQISNQVDNQEGVSMQYDFRSVYGTVLMDWFGVPEDKVRQLLFEDFQKLPLIQGCDATATEDPAFDDSLQLRLFPNPFSAYFNLNFRSRGGHYRISLFDVLGHEIKTIADKDFPDGMHSIVVSGTGLSPGNYYLRIADRYSQATRLLVKG